MGSFVREAVKIGFTKMVDAACKSASDKMGQNTKMTENEKKGVEGLMCESMTFVAELVVTREASATQACVHLVTNGINLANLTPSQQVYCAALKSELALQSAKLAGIAAATYTGAVAGANGGLVAGGIGGTVVAGPAGTVPGAIAGGIFGAGGPLLLGSIEMYDTVATITDLAIDIHGQCGPLVMDAAGSMPRTSLP